MPEADTTKRAYRASLRALSWGAIVMLINPLAAYVTFLYHPARDRGMEGLAALGMGLGLFMLLCFVSWLLGLISFVLGIAALRHRRTALYWVVPLGLVLPLTLMIMLGNFPIFG